MYNYTIYMLYIIRYQILNTIYIIKVHSIRDIKLNNVYNYLQFLLCDSINIFFASIFYFYDLFINVFFLYISVKYLHGSIGKFTKPILRILASICGSSPIPSCIPNRLGSHLCLFYDLCSQRFFFFQDINPCTSKYVCVCINF